MLNTILFTALFSIARCSYDSFYINEGVTDEQFEEPTESYFVTIVFWASVMCANILAGILIFWSSVIAALLGASMFCPRWLNSLFSMRREDDFDDIQNYHFDHDEVLRRVKRVPFSSVLIDMGDSRDCTICFEAFEENVEVIQLKCSKKHIYHFDCLQEWIKRGRETCPICRQEIQPQSSRASIQMSARGSV